MLKSMTFRTTLVAIACAISMSAHAMADTPRRVDIPAGDLRQALLQLAKQYGADLVYRPEQVTGLKTHGAHGELTTRQAVFLLLEGTPLELRTDPSGAMLIAPVHTLKRGEVSGSEDPPEGANSSQSSSGDSLHLAQVDQGKTSSPSTVEKQEEQASKKKPVQLEEVVVTGSRIPLTTGQQQVQPVRSYTREAIEQSGRTTIADFLNTLPDVSGLSIEGSFSNQFAGQTTVQLHGLPVGTTLVLLNGRRPEVGDIGFFDLSTIPMSAVERIDVLPVGSSAIYGSDALAGAVNFILRNDLNGVEFNATQGGASGTHETDVNVGWGRSAERGSISIVANYQHRSELLGAARQVTSSTTPPTGAPNFYVIDNCNPGNIYSLNGQPLPGLGTATQAAIPAGLNGRPSTQAFLPTAGAQNLCNYAASLDIIPPTEREGVLLNAHYRLSDSVDLFTETLLSHEHQSTRTGNFINLPQGSFGRFTLGANNPFNPFGQAVGVSYSYQGMSKVYDHTLDFARPLIGIRGTAFGTWDYEISAAYAKDRSSVDHLTANPTALQAALDSPDPAAALNPFSSGAPGTSQVLQSLLASAQNSRSLYVTQMTSAQAWLRGPLAALPSGPVQVVAGTEFATEKHSTALPFGAPPSDLARRTYAIFAEAKIPLLANSRRTEGDRLALNVAGRYDHSNDFGGKATWQAGLVWRPTQAFLFRGGYAVSYKAPQLQDISGGIQGTFTEADLVDPQRGNVAVDPNVPISYGSNPRLGPETGQSHALSIVYSSNVFAGFRAELTQFDLKVHNYISTPQPQVLIDNPTIFAGAVTRGPPSPQDVLQGFPGPITAINNVTYNFGDFHVSGVNVDLSYRATTAIGEWTPAVAASNIYKWTSALSPGSAPVSYLSEATLSGPGFAPRWKGTASIGWKRGGLGAQFMGRYVGRYKDYQDYVPNSNGLGNFWTYDANLHLDVGKVVARDGSWLAGASVEVGAVNLFGNRPAFSFNGIGYDPVEYEIRGRFVYARLSAKL